jgi:chromosome segregation ATPase
MFWNLAIALLMTSAAYGQSLGDIARENREKQNADNAVGNQPKVITNKDLGVPVDAEGSLGGGDAQSGPNIGARNSATDYRSADQRRAEQRAAEQWKRQILAQENRIASLQARLDQINTAIRSAGGTVQYEQPYSRGEAWQLRRAAQIQQQLDEQKRKLEAMQEEARHAGMHTVVYDP